MDLDSLRREIDAIDQDLLRLFLRRMKIVEGIARYKLDNRLPVLHPGRERQILDWMEEQAGDKMAVYTREFFQALLAASRHMQEDVMKNDEKKEP